MVEYNENTSNLQNVLVIFVGTILIMLHCFLLVINKHVFNVVVCCYAIGLATLLLIYINKKRKIMTNGEYNTMFYLTFFIMGLEILALIVSFISIFKDNRYTSYNVYNRY